MNKPTVLITGATGFVGKELVYKLFQAGYQIRILSRSRKSAEENLGLPIAYFSWNYKNEDVPQAAVENVDSIIHLAGESISQRWSPKVKQELIDSRILSTQKLLASCQKAKHFPKKFVCASAVGIFGDRGDEELHEDSALADDFLGQLCQDWETEAKKFEAHGSKVASMRLGIVLGPNGGALEKMLLPFSLGAGGPLGNGKQWMSWIHIQDLVNALCFAMENEEFQGSVNAVAPNPVTNKAFTKALSDALSIPALIPTPLFGLKLLFGEMSQIMTNSQRVLSKKLLAAGFTFQFPDIASALNDVAAPKAISGATTFKMRQWIQKPANETFPFFSNAHNLEKITPEWLNFKIVEGANGDTKKDDTIQYKLKVHGLPIKWKSVISEWDAPNSFVDEQIQGPYKVWHHTHRFQEIQGGTLIQDTVIYKVPFSILGVLANFLWVNRDIRKIFHYRRGRIKEILNSCPN